MGIGNAWLNNDGLNGTSVKTSKSIKGIGCLGKKKVVHPYLSEQGYNTSAIEQIVHFENGFFNNICVVFMTTGTRYT